jgi:hypothetical protein
MSSNPIFAAVTALDDDFNYFSGQPPGEAAIAALESELGRALPPAHRALVATCTCMAVVVKEEVWPAPVAYEIRPQWQMWRGLEIFGLAPAGHPLSITARRAELAQVRGDDDYVPLAKVIGAGHFLCADEDGDLWWWSDDDGEMVEDFDGAVLEFLIRLGTDKERVKREGIKRS